MSLYDLENLSTFLQRRVHLEHQKEKKEKRLNDLIEMKRVLEKELSSLNVELQETLRDVSIINNNIEANRVVCKSAIAAGSLINELV